MLGETVSATFTWPLLFLGIAVVLFLIAAPHKFGGRFKPWCIPLGLASFAFAFFVARF